MATLRVRLTRLAVAAGEALRPVLLRVLPKKTLKAVKARLVLRNSGAQHARRPYRAGEHPAGVNLIGYLRAEMGLGQGCRLMAAALEASGLPWCALEVRPPGSAACSERGFEARVAKTARYAVNLIHINAEQLPMLQLALPLETWDGRFNIGIWLWELEDFPDEWTPQFAAVDAIWTPSRFNTEAIARKSPVPVFTVPYGIEAPVDPSLSRAAFGLPEDRFLFLSMYDVNSTAQRKNPLGAIRAFQRAFPPEQREAALAVKVNNPNEAELAALKAAIGVYSDSVFIIGGGRPMTKLAVNSLIACCDVFVSLHRSEGFGLVIAEAMLLGKPCIATNWSANTDFMDETNACPVAFTLVPIGEDCGPYKAYQRWAEPDLDDAASYMRRLCGDPGYYAALSEAARRRIAEDFSVGRSAQALRERLAELGVV